MAPLLSPNGDGRYQVRWTEDGRPRTRVFTSAADARRFHAMRVAEPVTPTLAEVIEKWAGQTAYAEATHRRIKHTREQLVQPFFGDTPIESITRDQVRHWVSWLLKDRQLSASTVRQHFCVLRAAMAWAVDALLITDSPCAQIPLPRVPRAQRAMALTRIAAPKLVARKAPGHQRDCGALADLRRALAGTGTAEELTGFLRGLDLAADLD
ncbi:phage integrase SAM-like domain-containing protein [Catelliglobosispora koreensis]|uniref:phage integrase SAM-like domain-containing protein n=1 Tax=Catelliglobosispora koreensis TaxID=129052 RepID=UPI000381A13E|nr:phage integrase SAM-like domain-containing protein [Catelliglobosispora koreensis]